MPAARHLARAVTAVTLAAVATTATWATPARAEGGGEELPVRGENSCTPAGDLGPLPKDPWYVARLQPKRLHDMGIKGKGVTIAVLDTGVEVEGMPYYTAKNVKTQNYAPYREGNNNNNKKEGLDCSHGTAVVSLIVGRPDAKGENSTGTQFIGMAPEAQVIAMRTLIASSAAPGSSGGQIEPMVKAIRAAIDQKVKIINISQAAGADTLAYRDAIAEAVKAGIIVVAAAGNDGDTGPSFPAAYPGVIAVGMTDSGDRADEKSQVAREGWQISVAAPGTNITAPGPSRADGARFQKDLRGTSFAAPLVAGTIALMLEREPNLTAEQVRERLEGTADPVSSRVPDNRVGYGIVNPYRAVMGDGNTVMPQPPATPTPKPLPPEQPPKSTLLRDIAIGVGAGSIALAVLGLVFHQALPLARRRHWRPADKD